MIINSSRLVQQKADDAYEIFLFLTMLTNMALNYSQHLKACVDKHKISEINPKLKHFLKTLRNLSSILMLKCHKSVWSQDCFSWCFEDKTKCTTTCWYQGRMCDCDIPHSCNSSRLCLQWWQLHHQAERRNPWIIITVAEMWWLLFWLQKGESPQGNQSTRYT